MNAILDNLFGNYTEYLIEYDDDNLVVYVSGLDKDGFWTELAVHEEVDNPENFAQGYAEAFTDKGYEVSIENISYLDFNDGWEDEIEVVDD